MSVSGQCMPQPHIGTSRAEVTHHRFMERCLFPVRLNSYHSSIVLWKLFYFHKIQIRVRHCKTFTGSGCSAGWAENLCSPCTAQCRTHRRFGECCFLWLCFAGRCWADIWQSIFLLQGILHTVRGGAGPLCQMRGLNWFLRALLCRTPMAFPCELERNSSKQLAVLQS